MHWFLSILFFSLTRSYFLPLDIQTPSPLPKSNEYNLFYFNFLNVSLGGNFKLCPNFYRIVLIFINHFLTTKIFITGICLSSNSECYLQPTLFKNCLLSFHALIPSTSLLTFLHFDTLPHPYSYLYLLPLIEKKITAEPMLSGHKQRKVVWLLHTGWPLCSFYRTMVLRRAIKNVIWCHDWPLKAQKLPHKVIFGWFHFKCPFNAGGKHYKKAVETQ